MALRKRGIQPETIRTTMIEVGPKPVNVSISWDKFASENRKLIEEQSNRFSFIQDPVKLKITGVSELIVAELPVHPDYPQRGTRDHVLDPKDGLVELWMTTKDRDKVEVGALVRLMGVANIRITGKDNEVSAEYHSIDHQIARKENAPFINWLPVNGVVSAEVIMSDASIAKGLAEESVHKMVFDDMFQFERFGYCRVENSKPFKAYFTHK